MKKLLVLMGLLWGGGGLGVWYWTDHRSPGVSYRTVLIGRGDIHSTINATGTLEPEEVVDIGAQIAGLIQSFGVDPHEPGKPINHGSRVEKGTVLAQIDSALFQARVDQAHGQVAKAEADIQQSRAKLRQASRELERTKKLRSRGTAIVAEQEYETAIATYESAEAALAVNKAALAVARADLQEASVNLGYTTIRSPVAGIILDRRVNIGQSVVASLNAPSLFLIAKELSRLEIWSSVNENDIGSVHVGQKVHFTVSSVPHDRFEGWVSQIRLNASMAQNVVTYTVVIAVDNSSGRLLPYLTARIQFEVEARKGVLLVPSAALRWQSPMQNVVPDARADYAQWQRRPAPAQGGSTRLGASAQEKPQGLLWIRQGDHVKPIKVRIGLSDGIATEIDGDALTEGTEIVVGASRIDSEPDALSILPHTWSEEPKK
jgi:HlyD family secretion protein